MGHKNVITEYVIARNICTPGWCQTAEPAGGKFGTLA